MVERQAKDLEVRGSNLGPGLNFSLEFKHMSVTTISSQVQLVMTKGLFKREFQ